MRKKEAKKKIKSKTGTRDVMRRSELKQAKSRLEKGKTKEGIVRFCALGGLEEIGRNMMFLEYEDEIIIIDAGIQFPEEETPGIDYIIPNTSYLELNKDKIKALVITHGHFDHIGAIPYIMEKIGNPPVYCTKLTREVVKGRQSDFPNAPKLKFDLIEAGDKRQLSKHFNMEFFSVEHNIPEGVGMIIDTPVGDIVHPGEFKLDYDEEGNPRNVDIWKEIGKRDIHTLMLDSTGVLSPGKSLTEEKVEQELEKLFKKVDGRIVVSTFSSLLGRLAEIIKIAEKLDKKIAISGYSMKKNLDIAKRLGFITPNKGTIVSVNELDKYDENKQMLLCTGAQGEKRASLSRIARGDHRQFTLKPGDTVILSSSVVPGNEKSVQTLKDNLSRQGADIYDYKMLDIHSSGHAPQEDLRQVIEWVDPEHFMPIHGYYFMRSSNAKLAQEALDMPKEKTILSDNGLVVEMKKDSVEVTGEELPNSYVLVDGLGVGDVGEVVLRDRRVLAEDGMVVIIATISKKNTKVLKSPDIISRGFVYLRENKDLLNSIRGKIRGIVKGASKGGGSVDIDYVKSMIRDQIGDYLYKKTKRRPMVLPVVIEV